MKETTFTNYIALVKEKNVTDSLKASRNTVLEVFKQLPIEKWNFQYEENKWTPKEILLHIIETERIMAYRALRIARKDKTPLASFDENEYVANAAANKRTVKSLFKEYKSQRKCTLLLFKYFDTEMLKQIGIANNDEVSTEELGYIIAGHELHHCKVLIEKYL